MSGEAFFNGFTIGTVSGVQVHRSEPSVEPIGEPLKELTGTFQATEINADVISALMGLEPVQAPKEIEFVGHGVTGKLRNIDFHNDGQPADNCGMVQMAMTGYLVDISFASPAKNRAWKRLQRRKMLLRCRQRERSWKLGRWIATRLVEVWAKTPFVFADIQAASHTLGLFDELEKSGIWTRKNLDDLNYLRSKMGLPPLTEADL